MQHIGIDLGARESQVCIRNSESEILDERRLETRALELMFKTRPASRVVMETCAEAFRVAEMAKQAGHQVRVVPAALVRTLGVGARGVKTDIKDARVMSEASCRLDVPTVHIPSLSARELRAMLCMRDMLISTRTQMINCARGYLRGRLVRLKSGESETFGKRVREQLLEDKEGMPTALERLLKMVESLNGQIKDADHELDELTRSNAVCKLLMSAPGVGPVTSARFVAAVDEVKRFPNAHALESYLGLTPGEDSSSAKLRRTGITKAGSTASRGALTQACWAASIRYPHDPLVLWMKQVAQRTNKKKAICAMVRKLAGVLYAMWRDNKPYNPLVLVRAAEKNLQGKTPPKSPMAARPTAQLCEHAGEDARMH